MTTGEAEIFLNFTMWYIMRESLGDDFFFRLEAELLLLLLPPESGERVFFKEEERGEGLGEEGVAGISMELMRTRRVRGDSDMGERVEDGCLFLIEKLLRSRKLTGFNTFLLAPCQAA